MHSAWLLHRLQLVVTFLLLVSLDSLLFCCPSSFSSFPVVAAAQRVTFLPGAVTAQGDVRYNVYDPSSPTHHQGDERLARNATKLRITTASPSLYADRVVVLDDIVVTFVDHYGVEVARGFVAAVTIRLLPSARWQRDGGADVNETFPAPSALTTRPHKQSVTFRGLRLLSPWAGDYELEVTARNANVTRNHLVGRITISIVAHYQVAKLEMVRSPALFANRFRPLSRQPLLRLVDAVGNTVVDARGQGTILAIPCFLNGTPFVGATTVFETEAALTEAQLSYSFASAVATRTGIARFVDLLLTETPTSAQWGANMTLLFALFPPLRSPLPNTTSWQSWAVPTISTTLVFSYCNATKEPTLISFWYPLRVPVNQTTLAVYLRGAVYSSQTPERLYCSFATSTQSSVVSAMFIDECNVRCEWSNYLPPVNDERIDVSLSLDGGVSFGAPVPVLVVHQDSGVQLLFEDREIEGNSSIVLDPFGHTSVGNLSVLIVDEFGTHVRNYTSISYSITIVFENLTMTQPLQGTAVGGVLSHVYGEILGFPLPGLYNISVTAVAAGSGAVLQTRRSVELVFSRDGACIPPPRVLNMTSSRCVTLERTFPEYALRCPTGEVLTFRISGVYFGNQGAVVYIGSTPCVSSIHDPLSVGSQLIAQCIIPTTSRNATIAVVTRDTQLYRSSGPVLFAHDAVSVTEVTGCPYSHMNSTARCWTNKTTKIVVTGSGFGLIAPQIYLRSALSNAVLRCSNVTYISPQQASCAIPAAVGAGFVVQVRNTVTTQLGYGLPSVNYNPDPGSLCPTDAEGYFCSQRGTCKLLDGTCNCTRDAKAGYWSGRNCDTCTTLYFGPNCSQRCPDCSTATSSVCDYGVQGSGRCNCTYGYGGTLCDQPCPGGATNPCSGHGTCNAQLLTCTCDSSMTNGYWSGTSCAVCSERWSGSNCTRPCPLSTTGEVCSGHGVCIDGACKCAEHYCNVSCDVSFDGCGGCSTGLYGLQCEHECPGGASNVCHGHGFCSEGLFGNGFCTCSSQWGGSSCNVTCPLGPSNPCAGHGSCDLDSGVCTCDSGYVGKDCARECPGGHATPCNGNGACAVDTGNCTCTIGWSGVACNVVCPGGLTSPCSLHGTCVQSNSSCTCYRNTAQGYWAGRTCSQCHTDWWGASCRQQCPFHGGLQCGGHGQCSNAVVCSCYASSTTGFWSGADCSDCQFGYYGPTCTSECPGTSCNPCFGRGQCSQGVTGTGMCTCDSGPDEGFWTGVVCDRCSAGWFGVNCTSKCPQNSETNETCSSRGQCSDGVLGTGTCRCFSTYGGDACEKCAVGFLGANCSQTCPGTNGIPCSGRGDCEYTETSDGNCVCLEGYGGSSCELECPQGPYGICNAQGVCVHLSSQMVCVNCSNTASGAWTGSACSQCVSGYFGSLCNQQCPGGASNTCNGRGTCDDDYTGTGTCSCFNGYAGFSCELTCTGGELLPCGGHGTCNAVTAACTCDANANDGYWTGNACTECDPLYASSSCNRPCPTSVSGTACSAHGFCYEGTCLYCEPGFCGETCSQTTGCSSCPRYTFGPTCEPCPGGTSNPCSSHGTCLEGARGSGRCLCQNGYKGVSCNIACPGPAGVPCYNRGTCSDEGTCSCVKEWAGSDCNVPCNGYSPSLPNSQPCNGVGRCNAENGMCSCKYGFGGAACEIACPGNSTGTPCNNHGSCLSSNGTCACYEDDRGYWGGESCSRCKDGYFGAACLGKCVNGVSDSTFFKCTCFEYWSGEDCSIPCPGLLDASANFSVCYSHGVCDYGNTKLGKCSCFDDWYNATCRKSCTKAYCDSVLVNGQCNALTGECECQADANGQWDYTTEEKLSCEVCNPFYFGANCESPCACNQHGTCDRRTGTCSCYNDAVRGFWGGITCAACADGYIGVRCQYLNVAISPLGTVAYAVTVPDLAPRVGVICHDELFPFIYVGSNPIVVHSNEQQSIVTLPGVASLCLFPTTREMHLVVLDGSQILRVVFNRATGEYLRTDLFSVVSAAVTTTTSSHRGTEGTVQEQELYHRPYSMLDGAIQLTVSENSLAIMFFETSLLELRPTPLATLSSVGVYESASTSQILIGGVRDSHWEIAQVQEGVPMEGSNFTYRYFYDVFGSVLQIPSPMVKAIIPTSDAVIAVMTGADGMYLVRMNCSIFDLIENNPDNRTLEADIANALLTQYFYSSRCDVTVTLLDEYSSSAYFALNCNGEPSTIFRFRVSTCIVSGTYRLSTVGADPQVAVAMSVQQTTRILEVLTPLRRSQRVERLALFSVSGLAPQIADTKGGTRITLVGDGFVSGMSCVFGEAETVATAQFLDSTRLVCVAPPGGTVDCAGEPVEVKIGSSAPTNNNQMLQRVASPLIRSVTNLQTNTPIGFLRGGDTSASGSGFVLTSDPTLLKCLLYSPESTRIITDATFVNSYEVICHIPRLTKPLPKPSYLEVSVDGTVFSDSRVFFDVVGNASSLFVESPSSGFKVQASNSTPLPKITVMIGDEVQHGLGRYFKPSKRHFVMANLLTTGSLTSRPVVLRGRTTAPVVDGVAYFESMFVTKPTTGTLTIFFHDNISKWSSTLFFTVIEGEPYALNLTTQPSSTVTNDNPTLSNQPIVEVVDSSGNALKSLADKALSINSITLFYSYHNVDNTQENRTVSVRQLNAQFRVDGVFITGIIQHQYFLEFTAEGLPEPKITSNPITVGWCQPTQYAVEGSARCYECPAAGKCDGTFNLQVQDGWWRADNSTLNFYSCGAPYGGDSCFNNGACRPGYYGPRCSLCQSGYGRNGRFCKKCSSSTVDLVIVLLVSLLIVIAIAFIVFTIVSTSSADLLPVLLRNFITYLQILARLTDSLMPWPPVLDSIWRWLSNLASLQVIDFSPFDCAASVDYFQRYTVTMVLPWIVSIVVAPFAIFIVRSHQRRSKDMDEAIGLAVDCREVEDATLLKEMRVATAQRRSTIMHSSPEQDTGPAVLGVVNPLQPRNPPSEGALRSVLTDEELLRITSDTTDEQSDLLTKTRIDHVQQIVQIREARFRNVSVLVVTFVTVFTLLYPTLVQSSGEVLRCEELDMGRAGIQSVSSNQRDVQCNSFYYQVYATVALSMILVYGVSIPAALVIVVLVMRRIGGMPIARAVLAFTMSGFRSELWFWESVNLVRKFMTMFVVVFVRDAKLQMIVFMWVLVIGFVLHLAFEPYTNHMVHILESLSMVATIITLNLVLLFFFLTEAQLVSDDWKPLAISIAIIMMNGATVLMYIYAMCRYAAYRFVRWRHWRHAESSVQFVVASRKEALRNVVAAIAILRQRREELDEAIDAMMNDEDSIEDTAKEHHKALADWTFPSDMFGGHRDSTTSVGEDEEADDESDDDDSSPVKMPSNSIFDISSRQLSRFDSEKPLGRRATVVSFANADGLSKRMASSRRRRRQERSISPSQSAEFVSASAAVIPAGDNDLWVSSQQSCWTLPSSATSHSAVTFDKKLLGIDDDDDESGTGERVPPLQAEDVLNEIGPESQPVGLTAELLRRLHQNHSPAPPMPRLTDLAHAIPVDETELYPPVLQLKLPDSESSEDDEDRIRSPTYSKRNTMDRVSGWREEVEVEPPSASDKPSPAATSFAEIEYHYQRDPEAEADFLEGRTDVVPPARRTIFTEKEPVFEPRDEMSKLNAVLSASLHVDALDGSSDSTPLASVMSATLLPPTGKKILERVYHDPFSTQLTTGPAGPARAPPTRSVSHKQLRDPLAATATANHAAGRRPNREGDSFQFFFPGSSDDSSGSDEQRTAADRFVVPRAPQPLFTPQFVSPQQGWGGDTTEFLVHEPQSTERGGTDEFQNEFGVGSGLAPQIEMDGFFVDLFEQSKTSKAAEPAPSVVFHLEVLDANPEGSHSVSSKHSVSNTNLWNQEGVAIPQPTGATFGAELSVLGRSRSGRPFLPKQRRGSVFGRPFVPAASSASSDAPANITSMAAEIFGGGNATTSDESSSMSFSGSTGRRKDMNVNDSSQRLGGAFKETAVYQPNAFAEMIADLVGGEGEETAVEATRRRPAADELFYRKDLLATMEDSGGHDEQEKGKDLGEDDDMVPTDRAQQEEEGGARDEFEFLQNLFVDVDLPSDGVMVEWDTEALLEVPPAAAVPPPRRSLPTAYLESERFLQDSLLLLPEDFEPVGESRPITPPPQAMPPLTAQATPLTERGAVTGASSSRRHRFRTAQVVAPDDMAAVVLPTAMQLNFLDGPQ